MTEKRLLQIVSKLIDTAGTLQKIKKNYEDSYNLAYSKLLEEFGKLLKELEKE